MKLHSVEWLSIRRVEIVLEDGEIFTSFAERLEPNVYRVFFDKLAHVLYKEDGDWHMIEEEVYGL